MAKSIKKKNSAKSEKILFLKAFIISALVSLSVFFILTAIFSLVALKQDLNESYYIPLVLLSCGLSGFAGGFFCVLQTKKNGLVSGLLCAMPVYVIIIMISMIVSESGVSVFGWVAMGTMMLSSGFGGIISANRKKKTKIK